MKLINMNTETSKSEYMLLFRGTEWDGGLSPEETQKVLGQFMGWLERLMAEGTAKGGQPLENRGRIVSGKKNGGIVDGPFAESKEAIGGYFLLQGVGLEQAVEIARACPALKYGMTVEVRPVAEQCPIARRVETESNEKTALVTA
jgi:hypothetical protein